MKGRGYNSKISWISMVAIAVIGFLITVPMRLLGLFFVIILDHYNVSRDEALIPILAYTTIRSLSGPIVGYIGQTCGLQVTILIGCLLACLGTGLSSFTQDITSLTICFGFIYGVGLSLSVNLINSVIRINFTKYLSLTSGILITAMSLGSTVMTPVIHYLRNSYGASGMFLILSGIFLNTIPAALFLKDPKNEEREHQINLIKVHCTNNNQANSPIESEKFIKEEKKNEVILQIIPTNKCESVSSEDQRNLSFEDNKDFVNEDSVIQFKKTNLNKSYIQSETATAEKQTLIENPSQTKLLKNSKPDVDIVNNSPMLVNGNNKATSVESVKKHCMQQDTKSVLKKNNSEVLFQAIRLMYKPKFIVHMIIQSGQAFGYGLILSVLIDYARDRQISTEDALYFLTFMPITQIIGSLGFNWVTDGAYMTRTNFCMICFIIYALDIIFLIWSWSFTLLMIGYLVYGCVNGALEAVFPGMIMDNIEREQQNMALASRFALFGLISPSISPLVGYFRGYLGSYDGIYYLTMGVAIFSGVLAKLFPVLETCKQKRISEGSLSVTPSSSIPL